MCGNFGLIMLGRKCLECTPISRRRKESVDRRHKKHKNPCSEGEEDEEDDDAIPSTLPEDVDQTLTETIQKVAENEGLRMPPAPDNDDRLLPEDKPFLPPLAILESQTAATEIRGGQAGGLSTIECHMIPLKSPFPSCRLDRVRFVAEKRHPLAKALADKYKRDVVSTPDPSFAVTCIGHTRFATASENIETELHPHEWVKPHTELVWTFTRNEAFVCTEAEVGIHISHNGDFDALDAYSQKLVIGDIGIWLEKVLWSENNTRGDSPKIAGCMDLLRVQGRWGPAARLAYVRMLKNSTDVCKGGQLSKVAQNCFPSASTWNKWFEFLNAIWIEYKDRVIEVLEYEEFPSYTINNDGLNSFIQQIMGKLDSSTCQELLLTKFSEREKVSIIHFAVNGFLRGDTYNALTELMSRAEGSFGVQVHCTLEPGVVVIASKGQPMSVSFDPHLPICLFGSEAEAIAVPIDDKGHYLEHRIDLDSKGEIMRLGYPRSLCYGPFRRRAAKEPEINLDTLLFRRSGYLMGGGIEIQSYSIVHDIEYSREELLLRVVEIKGAPIPFDPKIDLVASDLSKIPAIIKDIDEAWEPQDEKHSLEYRAGDALCDCLIECMKNRMEHNSDSIDLLIGGIECSLWVAEQWAADLRLIFPHLNVDTVSSNKLLGVGNDSAGKVFFPGTDQILPRRIDQHTCVLLISQSGQTFATLHATTTMANLKIGEETFNDRVWILTGCFNSKMKQAIVEAYQTHSHIYHNDRVLNNYSGSRPAEPTTAAIAATFHTLTKLFLHLIKKTQQEFQHTDHFYKHNWSKIKKKEDAPVESKSNLAMNLSAGCIKDIENLANSCIIPNISSIVGYDKNRNRLPDSALDINNSLVKMGKYWARHVTESWSVHILIVLYVFISITLGLRLFHCLGTLIVFLLSKTCPSKLGGTISFSILDIDTIANQSVWWTIAGFVIQLLDALFYIYLLKILTRCLRWMENRPMFARTGKRTLVIVDTPMVHQMVENFVSKLFSQAYGDCSIEVHGASGLDHFVHRFTHRVARGVLLAVGRPDGRLSCLAKSESAVILSCKQAAFIRNKSYQGESSGPEILTIGHNPYTPSFGCSNHIVLNNSTRRKFVDEYLYERLYLAAKPFTPTILWNLFKTREDYLISGKDERELPYGLHHINPNVQKKGSNVLFYEFVQYVKEAGLIRADHEDNNQSSSTQNQPSCDPAVRLAFSSKLDTAARTVQDAQKVVQQFYECRIASLERYLAFCVIFHAMAASVVESQFFRAPWNIARSQSNLRIATTASPISKGDSDKHEISKETSYIARKVFEKLKGIPVYF